MKSILGALSLLFAMPLSAVTDTWDGNLPNAGAGDSLLSTALNWADNSAPLSDLVNTDLVFAGTTKLAPNVGTAFSTNSITFNNTAGAFTFSGSAFLVGTGGIVNNDTQTMTFGNPVNFSGVATSTINAASGGLTFNGSLTMPTGTLTLSGAGTTTLGAGASLAVNGPAVLQSNANLTLNGGQLTRNATGVFSLAAGKTLTAQAGGDAIFTGSFTNATESTITVTGVGSSLTTTGSLSLRGGSITNVLDGADLIANGGSGAVSLATASLEGNATLTVDGGGSNLQGGTLQVAQFGNTAVATFANGSSGAFASLNVDNSSFTGTNGTLNIQSGADVTGSSLSLAPLAFSNTGTITITGTGSTLTLTGAATATIGASSESNGTLNVQSGGIFTSGTGLTTVNATGTVAISGGTYNSLGDLTINGSGGDLTRDSTGVFSLATGKTLTLEAGGDATFTGAFTNSTASTITVKDPGSTFNTSGSLFANAGTVLNVLEGGSIAITGGGNMNLGNAGGSGTLLVDGEGSSVSANQLRPGISGLTGTATFRTAATGTFTSIQVDNSNAAGSNGTLNVESGATLSAGSLLLAPNAAVNSGAITITGTDSAITLTGAATAEIGATSLCTATFTVANGGVFTSGTGLTSVRATGTVVIDGGTFLANGVLDLNGTAEVKNAGLLAAPQITGTGGTGVVAFDNGTLRATANSASFLSGLSQARVRSGGAAIDTNGLDITIAQALVEDAGSPGGGLEKTGAGTLTLNGANTYSGNTTVNQGILSLGATNSGNQSSTVTIANTGATLNLAFSGTDVVGNLFIGTTQMPAGIYGAIGSVLPVIGIAQITGTGTLTVDTPAVNDAPVLANSSLLNYTENQASTAINTAITVSDVDSTALASATVSITANFATGQDVLGFTNVAMGNIAGSYNSSTGVLTLTSAGATATLAEWQAALRAVTYVNTSENPGTSARTVSFVANDGTMNSNPITSTVNVTAVNDAPVATNLSAAETYTEDIARNLTDIVVTDPDSNVIVILTLSNPSAGSLNTSTSGTVSSIYNSASGVWIASGQVASVNSLLAGLTFTPASNSSASFTIATSVSDGLSPPVTGSKAMTGTAVNDAPTATNLSASETYNENTPKNLTDIVVTDRDSNVTATLTLSNASAGSLNTGTSGSVASTYNAGAGVWSASGAVADVNALLAGLTFTPAAGFNTNFSITTSVSDGIALALTGSKAMTAIVAATNADLAALSLGSGTLSPAFASGTLAYTASVPFSTASLTLTPTAANAFATVTVNGSPVLSGSPSASIPLNPGGNLITTVVTAGNGTTTKTYTVTVTRAELFATATVDGTGSVGLHTSQAIVAGNPAISYYDSTNDDLKFTRNSAADGSGTWTTVTVDTGGTNINVGQYTSLAIVDGRPAISYYDSSGGNLKYARASTSDGSGSWSTTTVDTGGTGIDVGEYTALAVIDGHPAISYYDFSGADLKYARASTADGSGPWTITTVDGVGTSVGEYTSLEVVDGLPAVSYYDATSDDLKYARASTADGTGAWTITIVDTGGSNEVGQHTSLAVVDGRPAISYFDVSGDLKYALASTADGSGLWTTTTLDTGGTLVFVGQYTSLAVVDGRPAISYYNITNSDLKFAHASTADGTGAWTATTVDGTGTSVGQYTSLAVLANGSPAVSYYDVTNGDLKWIMPAAVAPAANNALLGGLALSAGTLSPGFGALTTNYSTANVPFTTDSISVTPLAADPAATVTVNGATVASGGTSAPIALNPGANAITIVVTAPDGITTKTYTVTITRNNPVLSSLAVSTGSLSQPFSSLTTTYTASVPVSVSSLTVTPVAEDVASTITVNGVAVASGSASGSIPLAVGANVITTVVTAGDGISTRTYTVTVTRTAPNLAGIFLSEGTLSPDFSANTTSYTASVSMDTTSLTVTPNVADASSTVTVAGVPVALGSVGPVIPLAFGPNPIPVVVTAQDGIATKTYTVTVTRAAPDLSALALSSGSLSPGFNANTTSYTVSLPASVISLTVTPTTADGTSTMTVNGIAASSGSAFGPVPLSPGTHVITIVVTALGGVHSRTYTVTVTRAELYATNTVDGTGFVGQYTSQAIVAGNPAISYYDSTNGDLKFTRNSAADGSGIWTTVTVDGTDIVGQYSSLAVVDGRPAISYYSGSGGNLKFALASTADGSGPWAITTVDTGGTNNVGSYTSLAVVDGLPAISYHDDTSFDLKYARASTADGTGAWTITTVEASGIVGRYTSLAVVDGQPAISYDANGDLKYARASTADGSGAWTITTVDSNGFVGPHTSLEVVDGRPAISYYDASNFDLKYARASTSDGSGSWSITTVDTGGTGIVGLHTSLAVVDGHPAISYYDFSGADLKYARASTADGTGTWTVTTVDSIGQVGQDTSLAVLANGHPAISYYDFTNGDLRWVEVTALPMESSTALLGGIALSSGTLSPGFGPFTTAYTAVVPFATTSVTVTPAAYHPGATITVNGSPVALGGGGNLALNVGTANTVTIVVTAPDGVTTRTYTLTLYRGSSNAGLSALVPGSGTLSPSFNTSTTGYTASVPFSATAITLTPTTSDATATVTVNGLAVASGSPSAAIPLAIGGNVITTVVSAQDGITTKTYTLTVTRLELYPTSTADAAGIVGSHTSQAIVAGNPAISYHDSTNGDLKFTRNSAADGSGTWTTVTVDMGGTNVVGQYTSLAVVDGRPAISYYDSSGANLKYARASTADGSGAWAISTVDTGGSSNVGQYTSLAVIDGRPAISYFDTTNDDLKYARANTADGSGAWTITTVDSTGLVGPYTSLAVVDGRPAISYYDISGGNLKFALASTADGSGAWSITTVDTGGTGIDVGEYTSLAVIDGRPAISYYDDANDDLKYARASTADGTGAWTITTVDSAGLVGQYTSLAVVGGLPAISYQDAFNGDLKLARNNAADASGTWTLTTVDSIGSVGTYTSLVALANGNPAISYYDDTNDDLKWIVPVAVSPAPANALLGGLALGAGTLSPDFGALTTSYTAIVPLAQTEITITPLLADPAASVTVNGTSVASGSPSAAIPLSIGANPVSIVVTAQDGLTTKPYTVTVHRGASNADLAALVPASGTLSPVFASATTSYTLSVPSSVSALALTPTASDTEATVRVNGTVVASGSPSTPVPLVFGANVITTVVTAQDALTTKTYTLTVTRVAPNLNLASLALSAGTLTPSFNANTTSYNVIVPFAAASLTVTPTAVDPSSTITVNGLTVASGSASQSIPLAVGSNTVTIVLTALDGVTTKTYTLTLYRGSSDAGLSALVPSSGTLLPSFNTNTTGYSVSVPFSATAITLTPTTSDATATVAVNGLAVASGSPSAAIPLATGGNVITTVVSAQNGITTKTYTVTVTRAQLLATATVDSTGNVGQYTSQAIVAGNPAISYHDSTNGDLKFTRNSAADGSGTWTTVTVDTGGTNLNVGQYTSLAVVDGRPAISYYDNSLGNLKFARASTADGSGAWAISTVDTGGSRNVGLYTSLEMVDGRPAITYFDNTNEDLKYARASTVDGSGPWTITTVDGAGTRVGEHTSLEVIDGLPTVSYYDTTSNDLKYARASTVDGTGAWTITTVDTGGSNIVGRYTSLELVDGLPAISYYDASGGTLKYARASTADGSGPWTTITVDTGSSNFVGQHTSLAVVDGRPAISYYDGSAGNLKYARASTADGTGPWTATTLDGNEAGMTVGPDTSLAVLTNGNPAVSYYDATNGDLKWIVPVAVAPAANNPLLGGLALSTGTLSPSFGALTNSYTTVVPFTASEISITPLAADPSATVTVNGLAVASGSPSAPVALNVGVNPIAIVVTAPDGITTKTYTVNVTRNTPGLAALAISSGTLSPAFSSVTTSYVASVPVSVTSLTVTPVAEAGTSTITVNGIPVSSGSPSGAIALAVGNNLITTIVTAEDGISTRTYTVTVTRASANLSGLAISAGTLSPTFSSNTINYTASVSMGTTSLTVTPTVTDPTSTVTVAGVTVASGSASAAIPLAFGPNPIPVVVTAQDGIATRTYTVTVTRLAPVLVVEQGTGIANGGSKTFPSVHAGSTTSLVFTLRNTGGAPLAISSVAVTGADAAVFTVNTTGMLTTLPASSGLTTFTITFSPTEARPHATTLRILSDDPVNGTFDINLTGTVDNSGPAGGTMTLSPPSPVAPGAALAVAFAGWTDPNSPLTYEIYLDDTLIGVRDGTASRNLTGPSTSGTHTLKGRIYDSLNNFTEVIQNFTVTAPNTPIESWRQTYFGSTANTGNAADLFDFDKDGIVNLIEFAFGLTPTVPDAHLMPQPQRVGNQLVYSFTPPPGVSGVTYGAQSSETMAPGSWQPVPDTGTAPVHEFKVSMTDKPKKLVQLTITGQAEELARP